MVSDRDRNRIHSVATLLNAFAGFWVVWCLNALFVGFIGHALLGQDFNGTPALVSALASIGEILIYQHSK